MTLPSPYNEIAPSGNGAVDSTKACENLQHHIRPERQSPSRKYAPDTSRAAADRVRGYTTRLGKLEKRKLVTRTRLRRVTSGSRPACVFVLTALPRDVGMGGVA